MAVKLLGGQASIPTFQSRYTDVPPPLRPPPPHHTPTPTPTPTPTRATTAAHTHLCPSEASTGSFIGFLEMGHRMLSSTRLRFSNSSACMRAASFLSDWHSSGVSPCVHAPCQQQACVSSRSSRACACVVHVASLIEHQHNCTHARCVQAKIQPAQVETLPQVKIPRMHVQQARAAQFKILRT